MVELNFSSNGLSVSSSTVCINESSDFYVCQTDVLHKNLQFNFTIVVSNATVNVTTDPVTISKFRLSINFIFLIGLFVKTCRYW